MLDEMDRALHDALSIVKRTLESNTVNLAVVEFIFLMHGYKKFQFCLKLCFSFSMAGDYCWKFDF